MDTIQGRVETGLLNPLFEARLQYQSDIQVVVSAETREGELVGSGDGRVSGDLLSGNARWSMYAGNCAYVFVRAGLEPPSGQHLCTVHPAGVIATDDGAEVWFDARGYGLRGTDQSQPHLWVVTMAISAWSFCTFAGSSRKCVVRYLRHRVAPACFGRRSHG